MKSLAKETVFYGIGSVLPRLLTWILGLYWTFAFAHGGIDARATVGTIVFLYSFVAIFQVVLTYGMETGFFRFVNKSDNPTRVFSTTFISIATTTLLFFLLILLFLEPVSQLLSIGNAEIQPYFVLLVMLILCFDILSAIPFASLRYKKRPIRFATIRIVTVLLTVVFNLFFFLVCPLLKAQFPDAFSWFDMQNAVKYVLISNLIASVIQFLLVSSELRIKFSFDKPLLMTMLRYSLPILFLGMAGILNHTADRIIFPLIYSDSENAFSQLGIYAGSYKIAMIMVMFATAFRLAFDPFIFARNKGTKDERQTFADATKYFILLGLFIFLFVTGYIDILKRLIQSDFHIGLKIVPIVLLSELFFGIFFNLSLWYKLTDKTRWGAYMSLFGLAINLSIMILFVPRFGFIALAWAGFIANFTMMTISYFLGQRNYPIPYNLKTAGFFFLLAMLGFVGFQFTAFHVDNVGLRLAINTLFIASYLFVVVKRELPLKELPFVGRFFGGK